MPPASTKNVYEYSTKVTSAAAASPWDNIVIGGTVNIRNPSSYPVAITKRLVIPGSGLSKVFKEELQPGAATKVTSRQLAEEYGLKLKSSFEGFLVIQSSVSLDVATLYTVGPQEGSASAIKVVHVPERNLAASAKAQGGTTLEYSTKVTGAAAASPWDNIVIGGTVNIRNPATYPAMIRKQLVIPGAGVSKVITEELAAGAATSITSAQMATDYGMKFKGPFEGFLVIQCDVSLDVATLYTAGPRGGPVTAIDVVHVPERKLLVE